MSEKSYKDFNKSAKKGIQKYSDLSSSGMKAYQKKYQKATGKRATAISNKEDFYSFLDIVYYFYNLFQNSDIVHV